MFSRKSLFIHILIIIAVFSSYQPLLGLKTQVSESIIQVLQSAETGSKKELFAMADQGGSGAWFALAKTASYYEYPDLARLLRKKSWRKDPAPFALNSLSSLIIENPDSVRNPLAKIRRAVKKHGSSEILRQAEIAALVSQGKQKALSSKIDSFTGKPWETPVLAAAIQLNSNRARIAGLLDRFILYVEDPGALKQLPHDISSHADHETQILRRARMSYAEEDYNSALAGFNQWLNMITDNAEACICETPSPVFEEISSAARALNRESYWAELLFELADSASNAHRYAMFFQSGTLYLSQKEFQRSSASFFRASRSISKGLEMDRAIWYRLKTIGYDSAISIAEDFEAISWAAASWDDASRFTDVLDEYIHRQIHRRAWNNLESLYRNWSSALPGYSRAQTALMLAFAAEEGYVSGKSSGQYLEEAYDAAPLSWWGVRAAGILGQRIVIEASTASRESRDEDVVAEIFLRWDLEEMVAADILNDPDGYSAYTIRNTARKLSEKNPRLSIRVILHLWFRDGFVPGREDWLLRYPHPYLTSARKAAQHYNIPQDVYFGLIRTESAWDSTAVSRSGAMGLTQFMPATWDEWVTRLKYPEDSNPMDPETSLIFGAAYLSWLREQDWTNGWMEILASYNGGGGRIRRWRQKQPDYGEDLFSMSMPVEETRSYVPKVLFAATLYGYLYDNQSPENLHKSWGLSQFSDHSRP